MARRKNKKGDNREKNLIIRVLPIKQKPIKLSVKVLPIKQKPIKLKVKVGSEKKKPLSLDLLGGN